MQGTRHVRSLFRLLFGAVLLCIAWIVLSSPHADAAERPAPPAVERSGSAAGLGSALTELTDTTTRAVEPAAREVEPAARPVVQPVPDRVVVPTVKKVADATAQTTDAVAAVSSRLGSTVPVLQEPVSQVTDDMLDAVEALPVVGREPILTAPLPGSVSLPPVAPPADVPVPSMNGTQSPTSTVGAQRDVPRFNVGCSFAANAYGAGARPWDRQVLVSPRPSAGPPGGPTPWAPGQPSSTPPVLPTPATGGGAAQVDWACLGHGIALPRGPSMTAEAADWRTPRSPSTLPGTRPD
jgi:hypothetical protein